MTRLFLTLVFCLGTAGAATGSSVQTPPIPQRTPAAQAKPDIVQAALVLPGGGAMRTPAPQDAEPSPDRSADAAEEDAERPATVMLLAALALMIGIAMRRWGTSER